MTIIDPTLHHQIRIELEYLWSCGFVPFNASIKTIAERFNMSTRTFQRVVKKNGWCFEEWKQTVRVRKVKLLLDCSYSVDSAAAVSYTHLTLPTIYSV